MTQQGTYSAEIAAATAMAKGEEPWKALDELSRVWDETRDADLGAHICGMGEELLPTDFTLRSAWTLRELKPSGALIEAIFGHVRGLVGHDSAIEDYLRLVMSWGPDPRLATLALWVLSKDSSRKGARSAAAELFLNNADQCLRGRLEALADATLPILKPEIVSIARRCVLPPAKELAPEQVAAVEELRRIMNARLVDARAAIVRDVKAAISAQEDVEREAEQRRGEKEAKKLAQAKALRADMSQRVKPEELGSSPDAAPGIPSRLTSKIVDRGRHLWRIGELDADDVRALLAAGYLGLEDGPNDQPSVAEMLGFLLKWPILRCHGWVKPPPMVDARLEGFQYEGPVPDDLKSEFRLFCHGSEIDDFVCTKKKLFSWWD